jgi:DNA-binding CsgD family transcriptional regulator
MGNMWTKSDFQTWGAQGARIRNRRLTAARRRQIAKKAAQSPSVGRPSEGTSNRVRDMAAMYRAGNTLEDIGIKWGVTRERVRQILFKMNGHKIDGGRSVRSLLKAKENKKLQQSRRDKRTMAFYGVDFLTAKKINGDLAISSHNSPSYYYKFQKKSAQYRGIEWKFNLSQWWEVWEKSGKWEKRGRGKYMYCMARNEDSGPYEIGNVKIITNGENIAEGFETSPMDKRRSLASKYEGIDTSKFGTLLPTGFYLTPREIEVWELRKTGLPARAIAEKTGLTNGSISNLLTHIRKKIMASEKK